MKLTEEYSARINILRTLLILGIVLLHVPPQLSDIGAAQPFSDVIIFIKLLFEKTLFRAAVPTLSVISGYLVFRHFQKHHYSTLIRKKARTLLAPLVLWNTPLIIAVMGLQYLGGGQEFRMQLYPFDWHIALEALFAFTQLPMNVPLAFLRDLFVCMLIAPVLFYMLKRLPYIGLMLFISIMVFDIETHLFLRESILLAFYVGGLVAFSRINIKICDRYAFGMISVFILMCFYVAFTAFLQVKLQEEIALGQKINLLRILGVPAFWALSGIMYRYKIGTVLSSFAGNSFFIFCSHAPILMLGWLIAQKVFPNLVMHYAWYYLLVVPVTVGLGLLLSRILLLTVPSLHFWLSGGRSMPKPSLNMKVSKVELIKAG